MRVLERTTATGSGFFVVSSVESSQIDRYTYVHHALVTFKPAWDTARGTEQVIAAYREPPLSAEEMAGGLDRRLAKLQQLGDEGYPDDPLR